MSWVSEYNGQPTLTTLQWRVSQLDNFRSDDRGQHPAAVRRRLHLQAARGGRQQLAVPPAGELAGGVSTGAGESARGREVSMPVCGTRAPDTDTAGDRGQLCLHW